MKRPVRILCAVILALFFALPAAAGVRSVDEEALESGVARDFEEILDLWRDGDYGELYDRTLISGKDTKESFSRRMAAASLKPSCCWEKMQSVAVRIKSPTSVVISAKLGLDATDGIRYKTKSFRMNLEDGRWRLARSEILSLAEARKSKGSR